MVGLVAAELGIPWLLARAVDAAVSARNLAVINQLGFLMIAVVGALYGMHVLYLRTEAKIVFAVLATPIQSATLQSPPKSIHQQHGPM